MTPGCGGSNVAGDSSIALGTPVDYKRILRKLTVRDDEYIDRVLAATATAAPPLDEKTLALVRLAALVASDATAPSYMNSVDAAERAGATVDEIVATLVAVTPIVGVARVVSAAPRLGLAVGYDVGEPLEILDESGRL